MFISFYKKMYQVLYFLTVLITNMCVECTMSAQMLARNVILKDISLSHTKTALVNSMDTHKSKVKDLKGSL